MATSILTTFLVTSLAIKRILGKGGWGRPVTPFSLSFSLPNEICTELVLLAIVNVHLGLIHSGIGDGLRERFAVGGKLPAIGFDCLTF